MIVYLNSLAAGAGGETCFRDLSLCVTPVKGQALVFFPSFRGGVIDDRTMHCGMKVWLTLTVTLTLTLTLSLTAQCIAA